MSERDLWELARRQLGIFTRDQARNCGIDPQRLRRMHGVGRILPVQSGVFAVAGLALGHDPLVLAGCLAVTGAIASHRSSATLLGMAGVTLGRPEITVPHGGHRRLVGVRVHQSRLLTDADRRMIGPIPCTSRERTLVELGPCIGWPRLERLLDDELSRRSVAIGDLVETAERLGRPGRPGVKQFRGLLIVRLGNAAVPESDLESRFVQLVRRVGIPEPVTQFEPPWGGGLVGRVDFAYPVQRVVVELDGRRWHSRDAAFEVDRRRDQLAAVAGWRVIRITWRQLVQRPEEVVTVLRALL